MNYEGLTDEELIRQIRNQDSAAMDYLLDKYHKFFLPWENQPKHLYLLEFFLPSKVDIK